MKITLTIKETKDIIEVEGENFARTAIKLLEEVISYFGPEALEDGRILEGLAALTGENEYACNDFSCPEDAFVLKIEGF